MKIKQLLVAFSATCGLFAQGEQVPNPATLDYQEVPVVINARVTPASLATFFDPHAHLIKQDKPETIEEFYSQSMLAFMDNAYNKRHYAQMLSQDGRHITEFLELAKQYKLSSEHVGGTLRLFHNKFKSVDLIDDTVTDHILTKIPALLTSYFPAKHEAKKPSAQVIENIILADLTNHLTKPECSTEQFFTKLSGSLADNVATLQKDEETTARERLRTQIISFVELLLDKTMWYPQNHESVWNSVLSYAHAIHELVSHRIINHVDDRDTLLEALSARFITFIDTYGAELPLSFYEQVEHSVDSKYEVIEFLENEELDEGKKPKKELVLEALARGKACALAYQKHGLVVA